VVEIEVGEEL